ncbi:MAG TPA: aldo/keto reductase, partial [Chloroflexota bacterium]|nr:aldo/keto reductase [Chloroflexota bacterium]
ESNLGRVLAESGAAVRVGTKVRVRPEDVADAAGVIRSSLESSLRRLRRERVDLLQLHTRIGLRRDEGNGQLGLEDALGPVLEGFRQVQAAGLVGHIGFTGLGETEALQQVLAAGAFESMQSYFNAVNPSAGWPGRGPSGEQDFAGVIRKAASAGVGVIVIRPLAAGALGAVETRHPNAGGPGAGIVPGADYAGHLRQAQRLARLAGELGLDGPVELAVRFVLSTPGVSTVLVGFSDLAQFRDALRWAERGGLAPEAVELILDNGAR